VIVASRPGLTKSALWSSTDFPIFYLQTLTAGPRLQYLQRWSKVAELGERPAAKLLVFPRTRKLASHPRPGRLPDAAGPILLHLLQRRGLLLQERTELYGEYLKTFLDREETEDKEGRLVRGERWELGLGRSGSRSVALGIGP
jgi:hypothetical protein